jgi:hypothetical protein
VPDDDNPNGAGILALQGLQAEIAAAAVNHGDLAHHLRDVHDGIAGKGIGRRVIEREHSRIQDGVQRVHEVGGAPTLIRRRPGETVVTFQSSRGFNGDNDLRVGTGERQTRQKSEVELFHRGFEDWLRWKVNTSFTYPACGQALPFSSLTWKGNGAGPRKGRPERGGVA